MNQLCSCSNASRHTNDRLNHPHRSRKGSRPRCGAWVFRGTRVPVTALFENLEDGAQVADFVAWFPGVTLEQVRAVLEHAARSLKVA